MNDWDRPDDPCDDWSIGDRNLSAFTEGPAAPIVEDETTEKEDDLP